MAAQIGSDDTVAILKMFRDRAPARGEIRPAVDQQQIGFAAANERDKTPEVDKKNPFANAEPDDLLRFGLIPELVGRLPVVVPLEALDEESLVRILIEPKNAITKQYMKLFELENVGLTFDQESLKAVARKAIKRSTGARGLRAILETVMTDLMYDLPSRDDVREVIVTAECITEGKSPMIVTERPRQIREA